MDRIPLINPQLVKVVSAQAERTSTPVLKAEVVSSEPVKSPPAQTDSVDNKNSTDNKSAADEQHYKVVLKIGKQQLETISTENFKKGSQLDVKVMPGPELKIITSDKIPRSAQPSTTPTSQPLAQAAMQQLLADRIPKIQTQGLTKLIDQLSQLMQGTKRASTETPIVTKADSLLAKALSSDSTPSSKPESNTAAPSTQSQNPQTTKQVLANLVYQSLAKQPLITNQSLNSKMSAIESKPLPSSSPVQQVKEWIQQLPNSSDISNSTGLRNALNNTGVRAESQLSQLALQFAALSKVPQSTTTHHRPSGDSNANNIFQQLQKIQQKIFSKSPEPASPTDLGGIVKNTAKKLDSGSQRILSGLNLTQQNTALPNPTLSISNALTQTTSNWQNPLLNSQAYSTLNELMKDPLLQNPSSNNKFALSQILNHSANHADSAIRIPLNWPERSGNDATFLRTIQNLLGHIEREQGIQLQQSDSNVANNPNPTTTQNQQWLPLLIHHQQQLQLIEFFIDKEEKKNAQGEKKNHWFINLHFDLPTLGELGIEISMFENECNTIFWSESSSTLSQVSQHVQPLRERLTEQGIIVSDVQSRHGTLSKRKHNIEQRLVDIET
jgi:hypothetical protein